MLENINNFYENISGFDLIYKGLSGNYIQKTNHLAIAPLENIDNNRFIIINRNVPNDTGKFTINWNTAKSPFRILGFSRQVQVRNSELRNGIIGGAHHHIMIGVMELEYSMCRWKNQKEHQQYDLSSH